MRSSYFETGRLLGDLKILDIVTDYKKLEEWNNDKTLYKGYKYLIEYSIGLLVNDIDLNMSLGLTEDIVSHRARHRGIKIDKTPDTSEKIRFIRKISTYYYKIKYSKSKKILIDNLNIFREEFLFPFYDLLKKYSQVNKEEKFTIEKAIEIQAKYNTYIFLNDTHRGEPNSCNSFHLEGSNAWNDVPFEKGYPIGLQYLWSKLLGNDFKKYNVKDLHLANCWFEDTFEKNSSKSKDKKISVDSFWCEIREEMITPLLEDRGFDDLIKLKKKIPKTEITKFFDEKKEIKYTKLKEELSAFLYWYPVEISDKNSGSVFTGVPAFIRTLIGICSLKQNYQNNEKSFVIKFKHPSIKDEKSGKVTGYDYSYGVLIESYGEISDSSGWIIYFDCATDYSGYGGSLHNNAEETIRDYEKKGKIEVKEMIINHIKFIENLPVSEEIGNMIMKNRFNFDKNKSSEKKKLNEFKNDYRGLLLELLTYYHLSKKNYLKIDWNIVLYNKQQIDIMYSKPDGTIVLIDCKTSSNSLDLKDEINTLKRKKNIVLENEYLKKKFNIDEKSNFEFSFWFWNEPRPNQEKTLRKNEIDFEIFKEIIEKEPRWIKKQKKYIKNLFYEKEPYNFIND